MLDAGHRMLWGACVVGSSKDSFVRCSGGGPPFCCEPVNFTTGPFGGMFSGNGTKVLFTIEKACADMGEVRGTERHDGIGKQKGLKCRAGGNGCNERVSMGLGGQDAVVKYLVNEVG